MDSIIIAAVGFLASTIVLMTPIIKLNGTITQLNTTVTILNRTIKENDTANKASHKEFYKRIDQLERENTELKTKMNLYHE